MGLLKPDKPRTPTSRVPLSAQMADFEDMLADHALNQEHDSADNLGGGPMAPKAGSERSEQKAPRASARTSSKGPSSMQVNDLKTFGKKAKAAHKRAQKAARAAVEAVLDMGEHLMKARDLMRDTKQSGFGKWVEGLGISRMHANKAIRVYERLGHCATVDQLGLQSCYQLASGAVPGEAVDEVLRLTDEGPVDGKVVAAVINKYREPVSKPEQPAPIVLETTTGVIAVKLRAPGDDPIQALQEAIDAYRAGQTFAA